MGTSCTKPKSGVGVIFVNVGMLGECVYGYKPGKGLKIVKCEVCLETQKCLEGMLAKW